MKQGLLIAIALVALLGGVGYFIPRMIAASGARPFYGNFDMGLRCMGGHEIFLYLDDSQAYKNCPGHRDLDPMGPVIRSADSVTIMHSSDNTPWLRIEYDGHEHTITNPVKGWTEKLPQVANPWRTWLPTLLPE